MKRMLIRLLAALMLLNCAALGEAPSAPAFDPEELTQMTYLQVTDAYNAACGLWWEWPPELWLAYSADLRQLVHISSLTGEAIAATEYILPPEDALTAGETAVIAMEAAAAEGLEYVNRFFFAVEGRCVCKVLLTDGVHIGSHAVEMDCLTGEVLAVQTYEPQQGPGRFLTPSAVWDATSEPLPADG